MPRGRPRKEPAPLQSAEQLEITRIIAETAQEYCGIPGCMIKMHIDEAQEMIMRLKLAGYIIIKE